MKGEGAGIGLEGEEEEVEEGGIDVSVASKRIVGGL